MSSASWMSRLGSAAVMWTVLGVSAIGPAVAGRYAWNAAGDLEEEGEAFVGTTHVRGWARADGGERPAVTLVPRFCDATNSSYDFRGMPVHSGPYTLHQGSASDRGDLWIKIVEDELHGAGLKFQLPGEDPIVLEKSGCDDLRFARSGDNGSLRFDCRRGARRLQGAVDFRNCGSGWWPNAMVFWRDRGLW